MKKRLAVDSEAAQCILSYKCADSLQAMDLDELLEPGYPVYLNFSSVDPSQVPHSLQVCSHMLFTVDMAMMAASEVIHFI